MECVAFSPCGSCVVSGSRDRTVRIWNVATGEEECVFNDHSNSVDAVAFAHDGSRVASGSKDRTFRIWNVATGEAECMHEERYPYRVTCIAFSHDDSRVVFGYDNGTIKIWDITTQEFIESCQLPEGSQVIFLAKAGSRSWIQSTKMSRSKHPYLQISSGSWLDHGCMIAGYQPTIATVYWLSLAQKRA